MRTLLQEKYMDVLKKMEAQVLAEKR